MNLLLPTKAETRTSTLLIEHKLCTAQRAMESHVHISISDRIKCTKIQNWNNRHHQENITSSIDTGWTPCPPKMTINRWTTRFMDWQPRTGKRKRGRQRRRWRVDIRVYAGTSWTRTARNRNEWQFILRDTSYTGTSLQFTFFSQ